MDLETLLERALAMTHACEGDFFETGNPAEYLGAILGELALAGRDKVTLIPSPAICSFGDWAEQLIAETTGKEGRGILPVVGEFLDGPQVYGDDRLFVYLRLADDHLHDAAVLALEAAGHPAVWLLMQDLYDMGGQLFLWEMATAIASHRLGINPFDQPDVEAAKVLARQMVVAYQKEGRLPELNPTLRQGDISIYTDFQVGSLSEALMDFVTQPGAYIAVQAYIQPNQEHDAALLELRTRLRQVTRLAVTTGYGPRFLHSTGQLHKGDAGRGLFIQITSANRADVSIPGKAGEKASSISFGVLKLAQALGDRQALLNAGRKVIRFHLEGDVLMGMTRLTQALK
jgi:hypothetical protein